MAIPDILKDTVTNLPLEPGIYKFYNKGGDVIYVGKAKKLKNRVSSYFNGKHDNFKTTLLVRQIFSIEVVVVDSEQDALMLENTLIKKYSPRFNIRLKDDKTYPWIKISNERFPRVYSTRKIQKDGSTYFGPYTSSYFVKTILDLFSSIFKLRNCKYDLTESNVSRGTYKVCLQYHIKSCKGPCESLQSEEDYMLSIDQVKSILKGNVRGVISFLNEAIEQCVEELRFEDAHEIKERIETLKSYQSKSSVVSSVLTNIDVYSLVKDDNNVFVNFIHVVDGSVIHSFTQEMKVNVEQEDEDILGQAITEIRSKISSNSKLLVVPFKPNFKLDGITYMIPQKGDKKKLLELSEKNANYHLMEKKRSQALNLKESNYDRILKKAKTDLQLHEIPEHIECFDNSNLQGTNPVAACVVFKNGKPSKKDYRHYNIKTVEGPNDFASMEEIVFRRYKRLLDENKSLPNLIVVDGGKGQLSSALKALDDLNIRGRVPIIGIAKRLEELFFPDDSVPLYLDKNSETLKLIQQLRDEAHRFGITFHRKKRGKSMIVSELDAINGVGEKTKKELLKHFKSVQGIKNARFEDLISIVGNNRARLINTYFTKQKNDK